METVSQFLQSRQHNSQLIRENLQSAWDRMKQIVDEKRSGEVLEVGDWVYLKLQPYKQTSLVVRKQLKQFARYHGPYKVTEKIGQVAYKLLLPPDAVVHPVFRVSLRKG